MNRLLRSAALIALLAACATEQPTDTRMGRSAASGPASCPPCPVCPVCRADPQPPPAEPLQPVKWTDLPNWPGEQPGQVLAPLLESCRVLARKETWIEPCREARNLPPGEEGPVVDFLQRHFSPFRVVNPDGSTQGLITGYYEPLLRGNRRRSAEYPHAVYGVPDDLLTIEFGDLLPEFKNRRLRGRLDGRKVVPYYTRAELVQRENELARRSLVWVSDPVELFFLQIQGSGRVELPDGSRVRIGYAEQNGHPYRSIGRWLVEAGELTLEQASMEGIKLWARDNPSRLTELLNVNPSYVFFRELPNAEGGPIGALGIPLSAERSIAVDSKIVPLGAPVYLATTWPNSSRPLHRLTVAQDTGGAIKGAVRADLFWGFGPSAGARAGSMRQQGELWVLLPNARADR